VGIVIYIAHKTMATYQQDFDKIEQLRKTASAANQEGALLTGGSLTLGDRLRTDLNKHRAEVGVSKLAEGIGQVSGQVVSGGTDIEARNANIDPLEVDKMRAREMAQSLGALATLSEYESSKEKTIEGIIGAGTNRLVAEAEKKKAEADAASEEAKNILEFVKFKETMAENQRQAAYRAASLAAASEGKTETERTRNDNIKDLKEKAKSGVTLGDLMTMYAKSLSLQDIVDAYNEVNYYKKPPEENASRLSRMYNSAKEGSSSSDLMALIPDSEERKRIGLKTASYVDARYILDKIASKFGDQAPTFWTALANKDIGTLARMTKPFRNDMELMGDIEAYVSQVRQQYYGSAFTSTEEELAAKWLADSNRQANETWWKIVSMANTNKRNVDTAFTGKQISPEEIENYWRMFTPLQTSTNDSRPPLSSFDNP
jgi:hypothetical protein